MVTTAITPAAITIATAQPASAAKASSRSKPKPADSRFPARFGTLPTEREFTQLPENAPIGYLNKTCEFQQPTITSKFCQNPFVFNELMDFCPTCSDSADQPYESSPVDAFRALR
jgi:hypothetical protein